jgi:hypothetical protein
MNVAYSGCKMVSENLQPEYFIKESVLIEQF